MTKLTDAVLKVMAEVGYIQKTGTNEFHKYKYASIEGVLEKVQPALVKCGLTITQSEVSHAIIAEANLMEAVYEFTLSTGDECSSPIRHTGLASLRNQKGGYDDKALNKCHTAARKYFILGMFQIPTGIDADEEEDKPEARPRPDKREARETPAEPPKDEIAKAFVSKAIREVGACQTLADLDNWGSTWAKHIKKMSADYPEQSRILDSAMSAQRAHLVKKAAAE